MVMFGGTQTTTDNEEDTEMTRQDMREFAEKQVAWYAKMIEADKRHIEWLGREIARSRRDDK